jgi:hypothetical protein
MISSKSIVARYKSACLNPSQELLDSMPEGHRPRGAVAEKSTDDSLKRNAVIAAFAEDK